MRRTKKTIDPVKRCLFSSLDLEAVGPEGLAARFTAEELRVLASEAGQLTCGNKMELAAKIVAVGRGGCGRALIAPSWNRCRGSGRTQRMLRDAVTRMLAGCSVYVVVRGSQVNSIMNTLARLAPKAERRDELEIFQGAGFIRLVHPSAGLAGQELWRVGRIFGASDGASVLIDHHVVEQCLGYALQQWLLWCDPETGGTEP